MMPTNTPSMNSRFHPGAKARNVHPKKASSAMPKNVFIRGLYMMSRRLSNWKFLLLALLLLPYSAASAATLLPPGKNCFYDANGYSLGAGTVQFYIPSTTTPKDTWQNSGQTILNTNPVLLDSAGCAIIYGSGTYRQVVKDVLGNLIWDQLTSDTSGLQISWGGVSAGSANAQTLPSSGNFSQQSGQVVGFTAGLTNTGATTVSIGGSAIPVVTDTKTGPNSLTAGQITTNNLVAMMYDQVGGKFHILNVPPKTYTAPTFSISVQDFLVSGTYTPTANAIVAIVECIGGGGGGGGVTNPGASISFAASGGGAGARAIYYYYLPASQTVTIGAGGSAGANTGTAGGIGGTTTFGSLCSAGGGAGGGGTTSGGPQPPGAGAGGTPTLGTELFAGQPGGPGILLSSGAASCGVSGFGGSTLYGPGGAGVACAGSFTNAGLNGTLGGGGSGAVAYNAAGAKAGGAGGSGFVHITEYLFTPGGLN